MIIGIAGRKRVGKNFVANVIAGLLKRDDDVELVAFADPIKTYCHEVLGIGKEYLWGDADKNAPTRYSWEDTFGGKDVPTPGGPMTVRQIMQVVGTELGRNIWGKDIWIHAMENRIKNGAADSWIITDVRMVNEAEAVRKWGGIVIRVDGASREGAESVDMHETERMIDSLKVDAIIDNGPGMTKEGLEDQARKILRWESTTAG